MNTLKFEYKSMAIIIVVGYALNSVFGTIGVFFPVASYPQLLCYQIEAASAIMASVLAARYTGLRGQHVAASAFILLGITHGVSMAALGLTNFNVERGVAVIMPLMPTVVLLFWCTIFPLWLRLVACLPVLFFVYTYTQVVQGGAFYDSPLQCAYTALMVVENLWSYYIYKDWKKEIA